MPVSVKWNDKEVQNPILRVVVGLAIIGGLIGVLLFIVIGIPLLILSVPVHFILKLFGRKGFVSHNRLNGTFNYNVSFDGFRKA